MMKHRSSDQPRFKDIRNELHVEQFFQDCACEIQTKEIAENNTIFWWFHSYNTTVKFFLRGK